MKKLLLFLLLSAFAFGQKIKMCDISESDLSKFSETIATVSGINKEAENKKTSLGYVSKFGDDLKISFVSSGSTYSLNKISGDNTKIKTIWRLLFNSDYSEESKEYSNTIIKSNGSDIRLQSYDGHFYIEKYSCPNN